MFPPLYQGADGRWRSANTLRIEAEIKAATEARRAREAAPPQNVHALLGATASTVYDLYIKELDMKYEFIGGEIVWVDGGQYRQYDWFIKALHANVYYDGNRFIWLMAEQGSSWANIHIDMPTSIVPKRMTFDQQGYDQTVQNFKDYLHRVWTLALWDHR